MTELEVTALVADDELDQPAEAAAPVGPDRADAPVSEVTERFLRAIIARVPLERIEELHLFAPLRQGGAETGIAVIAARAPIVRVPVAAPSEAELTEETIQSDAVDSRDTVAEPVASESVYASDHDLADSPPALPVESATESATESDLASDLESPDESPLEIIAPAPSVHRHTVYTARYRLVLKGPDRGKWEADVVDEADAPLITVEMVVRGVQRRAGEDSEILRYSGRQIARALRMEWPLPAE